MAKEPEWGSIGPVWWHHHGTKMRRVIADSATGRRFLKILGSAAQVTIMESPNGWLVEWMVIQSQNENSSGKVIMTARSLGQAFGLEDGELQSTGDNWLIDRYGGKIAKQGQFIRYGDYLNIPCPGTGHDGDPNVSVELDDEIKEAVRRLLQVA